MLLQLLQRKGLIMSNNKPVIKLDEEWLKANNNATARASIAVETEISRRITKRYNLKKKDVKDIVKVFTKKDETAAYIFMHSGSSELSMFNPKEKVTIRKGKRKVKGLYVNITKGKRQLISSGFAMKKSTAVVFKKRSNKESNIKHLYGVNIPKIVESPQFTNDILTVFKTRFHERLDYELTRRGF